MDFIDKFVLPPTSREHLLLFKYILILLFTVHFSYVGMIIGNSLYSLFYNISGKRGNNQLYSRFAGNIMDLVLMNKYLIVVFGILPAVFMSFIYDEILYKSHIATTVFLVYSTAVTMVGLIFLYIYKNTFPSREKNFILHILSGLFGLFMLLASYLVFTASTGLLLYHEKWTHEPYEMIFSLNVILRYFYFITASFAISGGSILFFFFCWEGGKKDMDEDYKDLVTKIGVNYTFVFIILQIFYGFLFLLTLPHGARSADVVGPSALILLISYGLVIMLYRNDLKFEVPVLIGFLLLFLCMAMNDYINREVAIASHTKILIAMADKAESERTGKPLTANTTDGKAVYDDICSSCHHYDKELKGPPFITVLPKYQNKIEELQAFIREPKKINPDYPPMPKPAISEEDIAAVSKYLLTDYQKENEKK